MYLKALAIEASDLSCHGASGTLAAARSAQASEDALLDLAAELLIRRGAFSDVDAASLACRVRKAQALNRWRGQAA